MTFELIQRSAPVPPSEVLRVDRSAGTASGIRPAILFRLLACLACLLGHVALSRGADTASLNLDDSPSMVGWAQRERFRQIGKERQELYRTRLPIPDAVQEHELASLQTDPTAPMPPPPVSTAGSGRQVLVAVALFVAAILAIRKAVPHLGARLNTRFKLGLFSPATPAERSPTLRAEQEAFSEYLAAFRINPAASPSAPFPADRPSSSLAQPSSTLGRRGDSHSAQARLAKVPGLNPTV